MTNIRKIILSALTSTLVVARAMGQDVVVNPEINYAGAPRTLEIGGLVTSQMFRSLQIQLLVIKYFFIYIFKHDLESL